MVSHMKCGQPQVGPGSVWSLPGISLCPKTWDRSIGMPWRAEIAQTRAATASYCCEVKSGLVIRSFSISMPTERSLYQ